MSKTRKFAKVNNVKPIAMRFPAVLEVLLNRTSGCSQNIQKGKKMYQNLQLSSHKITLVQCTEINR